MKPMERDIIDFLKRREGKEATSFAICDELRRLGYYFVDYRGYVALHRLEAYGVLKRWEENRETDRFDRGGHPRVYYQLQLTARKQ